MVPPGRLELPRPAPEAGALSTELQGQPIYDTIFAGELQVKSEQSSWQCEAR